MKSKYVNLHVDQKRALLIIGLFILLSALNSIVAAGITNTNMSEFEALTNSEYLYSAVTKDVINQDSYYLFNSGITFAETVEVNRSINAEIVMQGNEVTYTDMVSWNTSKLAEHEIAISNIIAERYSLNVGDCLYSKHTVDNQVIEYTVTEILPGVISTRIDALSKYGSGVIVMGYDASYVNNMTHSGLIFTLESPDSLVSKYSDMPQKIIYRDDEIKMVFLNILPYCVLFVAIGIASSCVFVRMQEKGVSHNLKRLIILGYEKKTLDRAFFRYTNIVGIISIVAAMFIVIVTLLIMGFSLYASLLILVINIVNLIVVNALSNIRKRRLWR